MLIPESERISLTCRRIVKNLEKALKFLSKLENSSESASKVRSDQTMMNDRGTRTRSNAARGLVLAVALALGSEARAADGFWILGPDLGLTGQTNWNTYNGFDAPEGAYMGWLFAGVT